MKTLEPNYQTARKATGALLAVGSTIFLVAACVPFNYAGSAMIYALPYRAWPAVIGANSTLWAWTGALLVAGSLLATFGAYLLSDNLRWRGEHLYSRIGSLAISFGALLLVLEAAFRVSAATWAQDAVTNPTSLDLFVRISEWLKVTFVTYSVLTLAAFAAYGVSILRTNLISRWAGRISIGYALLGLVYLAIAADIPPFTHYMIFLLFGVLMLLPVRISLAPSPTRNALVSTTDSKA